MTLVRSFSNRVIYGLIFAMVTMTAPAGKEITSETVNLKDRQHIYKALTEQNLLNKHRQLVHMVHVCNLVIENKTYPVVEVREHVRGAQVPRGVLHVFILDSSLKYVNKINHDISAVPLYCKNNQLYWFGYVMVDGYLPEGNIVTFTEGGKKMKVSAIESNDFPTQKPPQ
jgi:hypothetical protein